MNEKKALIPSGWKETTLGEIAEILSGSTPSTKDHSYWGGDIPWITPKDLSEHSGVYISNGERHITKEGLKNSSAQLLPKNTVLFSSRAPIGYVAIAERELATNQGFKNIVCDEKVTHFRFIYYWLKKSKEFIERISSGSTFSEASASVMRSLKIELPPLPEQRAIAAVLSSLDDKIELLRAQNKTLENIAQALFKRWFESEKWDKRIESLPIRIIDGDRGVNYPSQDDLVDKGYCLFLSAENVTDEGFKFDNCSFISKEKDKILRSGKLNRNDIVLTSRGTVGNIVFCDKYIAHEHIRINSGMLIFRYDDKDVGNIFLYSLMNTQRFSDLIRSYLSGSAQPQLPIKDIRKMEIIGPKKEQILEYTKVAESVYEKLFFNKYQINKIGSMRDAILPKLMKGEVRVKGLRS